jgi:hypothetical protein
MYEVPPQKAAHGDHGHHDHHGGGKKHDLPHGESTGRDEVYCPLQEIRDDHLSRVHNDKEGKTRDITKTVTPEIGEKSFICRKGICQIMRPVVSYRFTADLSIGQEKRMNELVSKSIILD